MLYQADEYFTEHLSDDIWFSFSTRNRRNALLQADRTLTPYKTQMPFRQRSYAIYEQALWLLRGDKRTELQRAGVQSFSIGNISEHFNTNARPADICPFAWSVIKGSGVRTGRLK